MKAIRRVVKALQPLDTSQAEAALDRFEQTAHAVHAEARVLRTTINCADAGAVMDAVKQLTGGMVSLVGPGLRDIYRSTTRSQVPTDMVEQLRKLD